MADGSPVKELRCEERRGDIYERIKTLEDKVAIMEGEKKHARYITPLIIVVVMAVGGVALTAYIENQVRKTIRLEMKSYIEGKTETSWLLSRYP